MSLPTDFQSHCNPHLYPAVPYFTPFSSNGHKIAPYFAPVCAPSSIWLIVVSDPVSAIGASPPYIPPYPAHRIAVENRPFHVGRSGTFGPGTATISAALAIVLPTLNPVESPNCSRALSYCLASSLNHGTLPIVAKSAIFVAD